jgi:hypothetical protein
MGNKLPMRPKLLVVSVLSLIFSMHVAAQTALEGERLGALAPSNLDMPRPKPPFDLTGTWNMVIDPSTGSYLFEPHPMLTPRAQKQFDTMTADAAKGLDYRDDPGACWPLGLPRMMTRFWPLQIIQLPTEIVLITMFDHSVRWIYLDGRPHPPPDEIVYTYNGHSIGHWEKDTLVVDTVGLTDDHHWIQEGIPAGLKLHVTERIRLIDGRKTLEDQFTMTDPDNWKGEWVNTKRFGREDYTDIEEHVCIYEQVSKLPSFRANIRQ